MNGGLIIERVKTECFCTNLRRASQSITKKYDENFKLLNITTAQYSILNNINKLSSCSIIELSSAMGVDRTSLLRMLKPLISNNFIIEKKLKNKKYYMLSDSGKRIRNKASIVWNKTLDEINDLLKNDAQKLTELLNRIEKI